MIALVPLVGLLLILSIFVYILSSPLSAIVEFFMDDASKATVELFKTQNDGLVQLTDGQQILNGSLPMPVDGVVTSGYGYRIDPINQVVIFHTGVDIAGPWHGPIQSIAEGRIAAIGIDYEGYGNYVLIKHEMQGETIYSFYSHLAGVNVVMNQEVNQGSIIGTQGGDSDLDVIPGRSTGSHLHFEIRSGSGYSTHKDPTNYLFNK